MDALVTGATGFIGNHLVAHLVERGREVRAFALPGDDVSWLDVLGVEVAPPAAHLPAAPFRRYCSLASAVYRATGRKMPRAYGYALFLGSGRYDLSKAREVLGYRSETPLADAIREAAGWYRRAPGHSLVVPSGAVEAAV